MVDWIDKPASLQAFIDDLGSQTEIALDTEFERIRTYWPKLALLQINPPAPARLIDPTAGIDLTGLGSVLTEPGKRLIMHSASEDLIALKPMLMRAPAELFDTQIAATLAGVGATLSYQKLVNQMLGVELPKGETRSDWMRRPLSPTQLEYAIDDVRYLHEITGMLRARLAAEGRLDWVREEGNRMLKAAFDDDIAANLHWDFRNACQLRVDQQWRLDHILAWREATARRIDRPKTWLLEHALAFQLAEQPPATLAELSTALSAQRAFPKSEQAAFKAVLGEEPSPRPGFKPAPEPPGKADEIRFKSVRLGIDKIAAELGIDASAICARKALETRLRDGDWPADFSPWRRTLLAPLFSQ